LQGGQEGGIQGHADVPATEGDADAVLEQFLDAQGQINRVLVFVRQIIEFVVIGTLKISLRNACLSPHDFAIRLIEAVEFEDNFVDLVLSDYKFFTETVLFSAQIIGCISQTPGRGMSQIWTTVDVTSFMMDVE
jgi:hypothetical protein